MSRYPIDRMRPFPSRTPIALVSALAVAVIAAASPALAQAPVERPSTHTVKRGDTLWDLAQTYLGDAFQWPQIYKLNTDIIKNPHWIYPGQVFKLPGGTMGTNEVAGAPATAARSGAERRGAMSIFNKDYYGRAANQSRMSALVRAARTAVRPGDFARSPFIWSDGGPGGAGVLEGTAEPAGIARTLSLRAIQYQEDVFVTMPKGVAAAVGQRLLIYRLDATVPGQGQVVVPTGEMTITSLMDGRRVHATVVQKFEDVYSGHHVIEIDTLRMPLNVFPTRVEFGISMRVSWIYADPKLSNVGAALILSASSAQGLVPGDQVTLTRPRPVDTGVDLPEEELAIAQITRVTPWGASAVILTVRDAGVTVGMKAKVTAKMP